MRQVTAKECRAAANPYPLHDLSTSMDSIVNATYCNCSVMSLRCALQSLNALERTMTTRQAGVDTHLMAGAGRLSRDLILLSPSGNLEHKWTRNACDLSLLLTLPERDARCQPSPVSSIHYDSRARRGPRI